MDTKKKNKVPSRDDLGTIILDITEPGDGTVVYRIPEHHIDKDLDEWMADFDDEESDEHDDFVVCTIKRGAKTDPEA